MKNLAFEIKLNEDGTWAFDLDGIHLILDGFRKYRGMHFIQNPEKAIAYFVVRGNLYGLSNRLHPVRTVEAFFEIMRKQHSFFLNQGKDKSSAQKTG